MSVDIRDDTDCTGTDHTDTESSDRYAALEIGGEELLLYDENCDDAWIQSDTWTARTAID